MVVKRGTFTLVELLVVIGCLSLLAALLSPVLVNARKRARAVKCLNHLYQIGTADRQYAEVYRNFSMTGIANWTSNVKAGKTAQLYWPDFLTGGTGDGKTEGYQIGSVFLDSKKSEVLHCPDIKVTDPKNPTVIRSQTYGKIVFETQDLDKLYGGRKMREWARINQTSPISYSISYRAMRSPGSLMLFAESINLDGKQAHKFSPYRYETFSDKASGLHLRHAGKTHGAFADGTVRALSKTELAELGVTKAIDENLVKIDLSK